MPTEIVNSRLVDALKPFFVTWSAYTTGNPPAAGVTSITGNDGINADVPTGDVTLDVDLATPSGLSFATGQLQIDDSVAGAGLVISGKVLAVGSNGNGITVLADAIELSLPGQLSVSSLNSNVGNHTHAITSSNSITTATAVIMATDANGYHQLLRLGAGIAPTAPLHALSSADASALIVEAPSLVSVPAFSIQNMPLSTDLNTGRGFEIKVTGETYGRAMFYSDGKLGVGSGSATRDTFLSRAVANTWLISSDGGSGGASLQFNNGAFVGLGSSAGRIVFVDATNDLVRIAGADLHMSDGSTDTLKIRRSGLVNLTESDIYANARMGLAAEDDVGIFIDATNSSTDAFFAVLKDAENFPNATQIFSVDEAFTATIGNGTGAPAYQVSGAPGNVRDIRLQTNGVNRWILRGSPAAESGSNAGTDFQILARADNGAAVTTAITIQRSDGAVQFGSPTGGFKGAGTLNAVGVYDDNVLLSDYILDLHYDGRMSPEDAEKYPDARLWPIQDTAEFTRIHRHLPTMPGRKEWAKGSRSLGEMVTALWETVEQQQLQIFDLQEQINGNA